MASHRLSAALAAWDGRARNDAETLAALGSTLAEAVRESLRAPTGSSAPSAPPAPADVRRHTSHSLGCCAEQNGGKLCVECLSAFSALSATPEARRG